MKPQKLSHYQSRIMENTGCSPEDAHMVEDILREDIFRSTLDWQTEAQFCQNVRHVWQFFRENCAEYQGFYQGVREPLLKG